MDIRGLPAGQVVLAPPSPAWAVRRAAAAASSSGGVDDAAVRAASTTGEAAAEPGTSRAAGAGKATKGLSEAELMRLRELQQRDREVRQHEQAHLAASGGLAVGGPTYSFRRGPDGVAYAVGGEVHIDVSPGRTPAETIAKAETIIAAALAPASPSPQDRAVAARARQMAQQAMSQETMQRLAAADGEALSSAARSSGIGQYRRMAASPADTALGARVDTAA